jgi:hypothetical protein
MIDDKKLYPGDYNRNELDTVDHRHRETAHDVARSLEGPSLSSPNYHFGFAAGGEDDWDLSAGASTTIVPYPLSRLSVSCDIESQDSVVSSRSQHGEDRPRCPRSATTLQGSTHPPRKRLRNATGYRGGS